jgi:hypothetical protein
VSKIGFEFPLDVSQQWDGFNEPGVEHFAGSPFRSLGREGTQNAIDATKNSPTLIRIKRIEIATSSIPGVDELVAAVSRCKAEAANESDKAVTFFDGASAMLGKPKISVLQFADFNTRGVRGPCANGTPYFALMKATGQSKKDSGTATGSFGIGKFAPFTVSGLRTTFLTTVWAGEEGTINHYVQGKSILMSTIKGDKTLRGTGFWGVKANCQPLDGQLDKLPEWLKRDSETDEATGTTLSIVGFLGTKGWELILTASIAESFFGAISRGNLEVEIGDGPLINSATLTSVFQNENIIDAVKDQKEEPETFLSSGHFLKALQSTESVIEDTQNATLGHCRLHILVGESLPKKVAVLRNGMLITSELTRLRRFGEFKEFVAVLECLSDKGNELLRAMEPPAHDQFEPERLGTSQLQRSGRVALREVAEWVREMLKRHAQDPVAEVSEIDELAEFFGDDESAKPTGAKDGDENPRGPLKIRARPLPKKKSTAISDDPGSSEEGDGEKSDEGGSADGNADGDGADGNDGGGNENEAGDGDASSVSGGGSKKAATVALSLRNVRAVVLSPSQRRIAFTSQTTGDVRVELEDSGADTNRLLKVTASSVGQVVDGRLRITCAANTRVVVDVDLDRNFEGTVRVKANAI